MDSSKYRVATDAEATLFDGPDEIWWCYRSGLIQRHAQWHQKQVPQEDVDREAPGLFPPRGRVSARLAASASWRPCQAGVANSRAVLVNAGGIYGGDDGPAGMWHFLSREHAADMSFLLLDTGHRRDVGIAVLHSALHWLLAAHPSLAGRIILAGFSMGSATVAAVLPVFAEAVRGIILVAGQISGTEGLAHIGPRPVLIVQGSCDPMVNPSGAPVLAATCRSAGADVRLELVEQVPAAGTDEEALRRERMKLHHLRGERWHTHSIVTGWLREVLSHTVPCAGSTEEHQPDQLLQPPLHSSDSGDELVASLLRAANDVQVGAIQVDLRLAERAGR